MEFPVVRAFPEDKTLEIEGDAPVGLVLTQGRVIAVRDPDTAIAFPQPVPIDFDSQVATRGADCDDLSGIRAERLVVGIPATAVLLRVPSRAICGLDAIAVQGDSVDLDERGQHGTRLVRDRARRRQGSFLGDATRCLRTCPPLTGISGGDGYDVSV